MKLFFKWLFKLLWRVEVVGLEHYHAVDQKQTPLLIVSNHVSLLDGPLIDLFIPGRTTFMIHADHTQGWWQKLILKMADFVEVDMHNPLAAKHMIQALKQGKQGMIFPEGRISTTGGLMKVYDGTALVADRAKAMILPVHIEGPQYSRFSYLDGRVRWTPRNWFPKIRIYLRPAQSLAVDKQLKGHARHQQLKTAIYLLMRDQRFWCEYQPQTLMQALVSAQKRYPHTHYSVKDAQGRALSLKKLTLAARVLGYALTQQLNRNEHPIGLMLPNVSAMPASFFALQAYGKLPALLNFSAGITAVKSACHTAKIQQIITSRQFIEMAELEPLIEALQPDIDIIYLEEVREQIGLGIKLRALLRPLKQLEGMKQDPNAPACVLFTSGSEGLAKGVVLSHNNLISNIHQISAMFHLLPNDGIVNALPTFHSFGLTAGLLWPLFKGARVELYPTPLHYHVIPELIYQSNARLFFATDTFYKGYAKKADPYDFYSIEALVAGAEKLKESTRRLYADRFHVPMFEGYGVTEAAPVLAVNVPQACVHGSVGQLVPGIEAKLEAVDGVEGGRLWVRGPNIMLGYWLADNPGVLARLHDGWYDTGDIVNIDAQGYVHILGRAKRFAKIGGEMVSLSAIEQALAPLVEDKHIIALAVDDDLKGQRIVLLTDADNLTKQQVIETLKTAGLSDLSIPKTLAVIEDIPLLGNGKINYPQVERDFHQLNAPPASGG